jgi:hypothetical protein
MRRKDREALFKELLYIEETGKKGEKAMEKKIGFIGLGNMATAIIGGLIAKKMVKPANVIGYDKQRLQ